MKAWALFTAALMMLAAPLPARAQDEQEPPSARDTGRDADAGRAEDTDAGDAGDVDAGDAGEAGAQESDVQLLPPVVEPPAEPMELVVGVAGSAPFVVEGDDGRKGISVEDWEAIAAQANIRYSYRDYPNALRLINAVARGEVDVGVGPITINSERAARVAFTQPHYSSSISIAAPPESGMWSRVAPFLTRGFIGGLLAFLIVLTIVGTLLWLTERKANPDHFPEKPLHGIGNGIWLALVTMTTVGYGDRAPETPIGRVITGVWMILALITTSSMTAFIATALTLANLDTSSIDSIDDLEGRTIAVPRGTSSVPFVRRHGGRVATADDVEEAIAMVERGDAEAVVFDRPVLAYHLTRDDAAHDLVLSEHSYEPVGYGFCVAIGSNLQDLLDLELLELKESPRMETIRTNWLGE